MQDQPPLYVGIDVASASFDAFIDGTHHAKLPNEASGYERLRTLLPPTAHLVLEFTGVYSLGLATFCFEQGIPVSMANPLSVKRFAQSRMTRTKTDAADARLLSEYGSQYHPPRWQPQAAHFQQVRQLYALLTQYQKQHTALSNLAHQQARQVVATPTVVASLKASLEHLEAQIKTLQAQMLTLMKTHHRELFETLSSIPGLGPVSITLLLTLTNALQGFETANQLIAYAGLAPMICQSGTSVRKTARICRMGSAPLRKALYVAAWSAKRHNPACKQLYERLVARGKAHKQALVAVINKLLKQAFAVAKSGVPFDKNYTPTKFSTALT